jgi:hypothetical protein
MFVLGSGVGFYGFPALIRSQIASVSANLRKVRKVTKCLAVKLCVSACNDKYPKTHYECWRHSSLYVSKRRAIQTYGKGIK